MELLPAGFRFGVISSWEREIVVVCKFMVS